MAGVNLIVFRDAAEEVSGQEIAKKLHIAAKRLRMGDGSARLDALILAGTAECGLSDCDSPHAESAAAVTDLLASACVERTPTTVEVQGRLGELSERLPEKMRLSHPEGFAYYALHPADFSDTVLYGSDSGRAAVVGIRSIGTTLAAMAVGKLRSLGRSAGRITVRPAGHPYDRKTRFSCSQQAWIEEWNWRGAHFFILDEGPGLSGSSFLSVAEALVSRGIRTERITLIGTRNVDPRQLCAPSAEARWNRFRWRKVSSRIATEYSNWISLSGGAWRKHLLADSTEWPACWPEMESEKFLSPDGSSICKFEGFGEAGAQPRERAQQLYEAGFGPRCEPASDGMTRYAAIEGHGILSGPPSAQVLERLAAYCAYRARAFRSDRQNPRLILQMVTHNFRQEFASDLEVSETLFESREAVVIDGRMQPWKWIQGKDGRLYKLDAGRHGDDHFLPGPTDIAWDLAGTIIEWNLDTAAAHRLVERFRQNGGIVAQISMHSFLLAYSIFRMSLSKMALAGTQDPSERLRLRKAYLYHRGKAEEFARPFMRRASGLSCEKTLPLV